MDFAAPKRMLGWLQRTLFANLKDPTKQQTGLEAYVDGEQVWYGIAKNASTGVNEWIAKGGPGFGANLGRYWVSPAIAAPVTNGPVTLYNTVTAAIAAAVADGHDGTHPAVVLILPGTYTESVAMAPGVSLEGLGGINNAGSVTIVGTVTQAFAVPGTCGISNLNISGNLVFSGAQTQSLNLLNVVVGATSGHALNDTNSGAGLINTFDCQFNTTDAAGFAYRSTQTRAGTYTETQFNGVQANGSLSLVNGGQTFRRCLFTGMITLATGGTIAASESRLRATGNPVITIGAGATADVLRCTLETDAVKVFDGAGSLRTNANIYTVGSTAGNTLTATVTRGINQAVAVFPAYNVAVTFPNTADILYATDSGGVSTVTLPPIATMLDGQDLTIKAIGAANVITAKGNGGELIDAGNTQALNVTRGFITVRADRVNGVWRVISLK